MAENAALPTPAETLRAALEKIVFFEWRVSELTAELSAAQARAHAAETARAKAEDAADAAQAQVRNARREAAELESERARLASLLARPAHLSHDSRELEQERKRGAQLQQQLDEARRDLKRQSDERERWMNEMVAQARNGDEAPAALAQFISELRAEIIQLKAEKSGEQRSPAVSEEVNAVHPDVPLVPPSPEPAKTNHFATPISTPPAPPPEKIGPAARALVELCLRNLASRDSSRREQAARHLMAVPVPSAAPAIAAALGAEREPKVRAALAKALVVCGGEGAHDIVALLQTPSEPPLVRMAAAEALATPHAIETAAVDPVPAVRRRAAALAAVQGLSSILTMLSLDGDASVRAAASAATTEAGPAPSAAPAAAPVIAQEAKDSPSDVAIHAVQAAIFGLTEDEVLEHLALPAAEASALLSQLIADGRLTRRGKRLVVAAAAGGVA